MNTLYIVFREVEKHFSTVSLGAFDTGDSIFSGKQGRKGCLLGFASLCAVKTTIYGLLRAKPLSSLQGKNRPKANIDALLYGALAPFPCGHKTTILTT
jgi:hypothetical protein